MLTFLLCILCLWCLYNTISIKLNTNDDRKADVLDKMTLRVLQIHCQRLDRIEHLIKNIELEEQDEHKTNT